MLTNSKLVAFAATSKPELAKAFYSTVLNLTELADTPFALVFDSNGTTLRIQKVESVAPPAFTVVGWEVTSIVATVQELVGRGAVFEHYPNLAQDSLGIWTGPDGAMIAWFKDPDGNTLSVTQTSQ
jgi:predicted enzyme related to lactoylglutathione lyase